MKAKALAAEQLCRRTDPYGLPFDTTAQLPEPDGPVGQDRAMRAISLGARMAQPGYNLFVTGPQGSGKRSSVSRALEAIASTMPPPPDWCYVHNFAQPHRPVPLRLPAGHGAPFKQSVENFVVALQETMPKLFESDEYRSRRGAIEDEFRRTVEHAFEQLRGQAESEGLALVERPEGGFDFAPQRDGLPLSDDEFRQLPKDDRDRVVERTRTLRQELQRMLQSLTAQRDGAIEKLRALDRELGESHVRQLMRPLAEAWRGHPDVSAHLEAIFQDIVAHIDALQSAARGGQEQDSEENPVPFHRYQVNLLVDNAGAKGAPVLTLNLPNLSQLLGKVEHVPLLMTMITDFMFIRPGALHAANGGFLLIDALELLQQDVSWETLKRALRENCIRIANLAEILDRSQAVTIQPQPIPLDIKIVLFGEPWLYYRLRQLDPDFAEFFKIQADFSATADRDKDNCGQLLQVFASVSRNNGLRHLDRSGAARILDEAARMAGDAEKVSVRTSRLGDLLREADHFAGLAGRGVISADDVAGAVNAREDRAGRIRALEQELIQRNIIFIDTDGAKAGQVNALTVMSVGGFSFGAPARVTAQVRPGDGRVIDIERVADFAGPTHVKGVQILSGYLNGYYGMTRPLSLSASVAFEQSYGPIDGDSASAAELIAILSAIAGVPLRQNIAITGSIDQRGRIQPIGGVNEKIEGFFDICAMRGLAKGQGVIIPKANLVNLMLRDDVVEAVRDGRFAVHAVETVNEAIEILTGMKAGHRRNSGSFRTGSFNARVSRQLDHFARPRIFRPIRMGGWWFF
jgi:lon-related putative ATP-dependent protease